MSRVPRRRGSSGFYHVIIRGVGKQVLFERRGDRVFFLKILERYSIETETKLIAYCLMENHVHLLVCGAMENISLMMQKIEVSYSGYFNRHYERTGHLFQNRFLSEAIDNQRYLLTVFRYILNNPVKAGISAAGAYEWSSYLLYGRAGSIVDTSAVQILIGSWEDYETFIGRANDDDCLEYDGYCKDDEWVSKVIERETGEKSGTAIKSYDKESRDKAIIMLRLAGLTIRQIERHTGISRGIIQKAK